MRVFNPTVSLVVFLLFLGTMLVFNLVMLAPFLLAVMTGAILVALTHPLHRWLVRRGVRASIASILVVTAILLLVIVPLALCTWEAIQQGIAFFETLRTENANELSIGKLLQRLRHALPLGSYMGSAESMEKQARVYIQQGAQAGAAGLLALLTKLPDIFLQVFLSLVTCHFLLVDGSRFRKWVTETIPLDGDVRRKLANSFRDTSISVILATLAAAFAQAAVMFVAYIVLGVPGAFLAGGSTFVFAWIPVLGCTPVFIVGAMILYLKGSLLKALLMVSFGVLAGVIDNVLRPIVLRGRGDLHPLISLLAIFGGIQMFGILGVFLGPVLVATLLALFEVWPVVGARAGWFSSEEPKKP